MPDLGLTSPWMNVSGFGGWLPVREPPGAPPFGAFVTPPISLLPRLPTPNSRVVEYQGGFLLHNGHPNPGIRAVLKAYAHKWANLDVPVWANLLPADAAEAESLARELEGLENITMLQVGLPPGMGFKRKADTLRAVMGEKPVALLMPLDGIDLALVETLRAAGDLTVVLSAPRGALPAENGLVRGRLFGPCLLPQVLAALERLKRLDLAVVAGCGIFTRENGEAALKTGASAVQVDGWCWRF